MIKDTALLIGYGWLRYRVAYTVMNLSNLSSLLGIMMSHHEYKRPKSGTRILWDGISWFHHKKYGTFTMGILTTDTGDNGEMGIIGNHPKRFLSFNWTRAGDGRVFSEKDGSYL